MKDKTRTALADLGLVFAAAIWGSTYFIIKGALDHVDPYVLLFLRFLLAAGLLGIFLAWRRVSLWTEFKSGLLLGAVLWLAISLQTVGLGYTTATNSGFITGLFVVFIPLLSFFILRERLEKVKVVAVLISISGLWFLTGGIAGFNLGDGLTLLTALFYSFYIILVDRFVKRKAGAFVLSFQQFTVAAALSLGVALAQGRSFSVSSQPAILAVLYLALFSTLLAFVLQVVCQKHTKPVKVSLILSLESVFAAVFAWTLSDEIFVWRKAFGGMMIFSAVLLSEKDLMGYLVKSSLSKLFSGTEKAVKKSQDPELKRSVDTR